MQTILCRPHLRRQTRCESQRELDSVYASEWNEAGAGGPTLATLPVAVGRFRLIVKQNLSRREGALCPPLAARCPTASSVLCMPRHDHDAVWPGANRNRSGDSVVGNVEHRDLARVRFSSPIVWPSRSPHRWNRGLRRVESRRSGSSRTNPISQVGRLSKPLTREPLPPSNAPPT